MKYLWIIVFALLISCTSSKSGNTDFANLFNQQKTATQNIANTTDQIVEKHPDVKPEGDNIKAQIDVVDSNNVYLQKRVSDLDKDKKAINDKNIVLQKELEKERTQYQNLYRKTLGSIIIASGLAVAIMAALLVMGRIKDVTFLFIALSVFGAAVFMQVLAAYLVYIGIGYGIIVSLIIIYASYKQRKIKSELVTTIDQAKPFMDWEKVKEVANKIQSKDTVKAVEQIKNGLK